VKRASQTSRQSRSVPNVGGIASHQTDGASGASDSQASGLLNVFWQGDDLVIVERQGDRVVMGAARPEFVCYLRADDVNEDLDRALRNDVRVRSLDNEDHWVRVGWSSRDECRTICEGLEARGIQTFEGDVNPVRRWMTDHPRPHAKPRLAYLDIETDSRKTFRQAVNGLARVLVWSIVDEQGKRTVGVLEDDSDRAEADLLRRLWATLERFDQVASWNGDRFDFPIIFARTERAGISVQTGRWLWLDHLELFRRMNMMAATSGAEKQSYALNAIATALLGEGKDPFDASKTWEEWEAGGARRRRLVRYCVKDSDLMRRIEAKTGYIALLGTLAETCHTFADSRGINPTIQAEGFLLALGRERGHRFPSRFDFGGGEKYRGAYVMEPQCEGIVKGVHVADFASLYPTIIVSWNMSPDTRIDSVKAADADPNFHSVAPITETVFDISTEGILAHAVSEVMRLRKHWNDLKASQPPGSPAWEDANRKATAYKIAANSFYGVIGSPMSRFYDPQVAEAVTQAGKWLILETAKAAEARGLTVIYGDTDSIFVTGCTRDRFSDFVDWTNANLYPKIVPACGCRVNLIHLAYEKEFERIIFTSAKRYVGRYAHFKGTAADESSKPEVKGLEFKRGDVITLARDLQAEVIDLLVGMTNGGHEDPATFEAVLARWQNRILNDPLTIDDVVIAKSLNQHPDAYARKAKTDGTFARRLPHIELAAQMAHRGQDVGEGTKVRYYCADASTKPATWKLAEDWADDVDRFNVWDSLVGPPTLRLLAAAFPAHDWKPWAKTRPRKTRAKGAGKAKVRKTVEIVQ
jgi:DNA polymerase elongation subunit (family B)